MRIICCSVRAAMSLEASEIINYFARASFSYFFLCDLADPESRGLVKRGCMLSSCRPSIPSGLDIVYSVLRRKSSHFVPKQNLAFFSDFCFTTIKYPHVTSFTKVFCVMFSLLIPTFAKKRNLNGFSRHKFLFSVA